MITLETKCHTVKDGKIVDGVLRDFSHYISTTNNYWKSHYAHYAIKELKEIEGEETDDNGVIISPAKYVEIWALARYYNNGGVEKVFARYDSEIDADDALMDIYTSEILNNSEMIIHLSREKAEAQLADDNNYNAGESNLIEIKKEKTHFAVFCNGTLFHLGVHNTEEEAVIAHLSNVNIYNIDDLDADEKYDVLHVTDTQAKQLNDWHECGASSIDYPLQKDTICVEISNAHIIDKIINGELNLNYQKPAQVKKSFSPSPS